MAARDVTHLKLLIATGLYPPEFGGPATYTTMLEEHLPGHGFALTVAPYGWVRRYPKPVRHLVYTWKLYRESKACDVIYALDPVSVGLPVYLVHRITGKPYLLRIVGDYAWEQGQQRFGVTDHLDEFVKTPKQKYGIFVRVLWWVERLVARNAERIVVPSEYMKGVVAAWGIAEEKLVCIYSALFPIQVDETRDGLRKQLGYKGIVVSTAARLVPWKGVAGVIDAIALLKKKGLTVSLVVVGDGPLRSELEAHAAKRALAEDVRFVGRQSKESLGAAVKASDVFVLNTAYEGLSHQLLEVMHLGVPIVTTAAGGNPELIEDGKSGMLVPFDDCEALASAIERAATHPETRERLIQNARAATHAFDAEALIGELARILVETFPEEDPDELYQGV